MTPATTPADDWTDNHEANAALLMLDRLDVSAEDDARVEAIAATIRRLAALATPSPGKADERDAWQPIETAPKDGTQVLVYGRVYGSHSFPPARHVARYDHYLWWTDTTSLTDVAHWQPLPAPPKQEADPQ